MDINYYRQLAFKAKAPIIDVPGDFDPKQPNKPTYTIKTELAAPAEGEWYWQLRFYHYLTGVENGGKMNLYIELLDEDGNAIRTPMDTKAVAWTWEGKRPDQRSDPFALDKSLNEAGGNIGIYWGQRVRAWIILRGLKSDVVYDVHTMWPDNSLGNRQGHHSGLAVFVKTQYKSKPPEEPEDPPAEPGLIAELKSIRDQQIAVTARIDALIEQYEKES